MARLNVSSRRKRIIAMCSFWLSTMQLVNWFWIVIFKHLEHRVNSISLRRRYQLNFYERRKYMNKVIYASDSVCKSTTRMNRETFVRLCSRLEATGIIGPSKNMAVDEQVALSLHILAHHQKQKTIKINFECSGETVSRKFRKVINSIVTLHGELLKKPEPILDGCTDERWKWFKGCLGALDGTYIRVRVPKEDKPRYRTRKNEIATNVLGVCSQDMQFIYVLPGWEGSAADGRVLRDALTRRNGLVVPRGSYYLVDGGYTNGEGFLAPFRGQRYHLNDWSDRHQPTTAEELFNMRHSSARNVIERMFGILKNRWGILRSPAFYPVKFYNRIILACCLLHNFIKQEMDGYQMENEDDVQFEREDHGEGDGELITSVEASDEWGNFRKNLAANMFNTWRSQRIN